MTNLENDNYSMMQSLIPMTAITEGNTTLSTIQAYHKQKEINPKG